MRRWVLSRWGLENLNLEEAPPPEPGPGEVRVRVRALSLNYRDLLVIRGQYNPRLPLPAVPVSDGAGEVQAVGPHVTELRPGDRVMTHFVADWQDGPYRAEYLKGTLGLPGPGLAAEEVVLPARALLRMPAGYDFAAAATLPIAALTAWSALHAVTPIRPGETVLTLGTGGVSLFALQLATALGARVLITSGSAEKLARARELGAWAGVNYREDPEWDRQVLRLTGGEGADRVVENGGVGTLSRSLRAVRAGGIVALLGALTGLQGEVDVGPILMKRILVAGILVGSRREFEAMAAFLAEKGLRPVISHRFSFTELPQALRLMAEGGHFGKIVVTV